MTSLSRNLDSYLHELGGAVDLLAQAQAAQGDDRYMLLDLAADAWIAARDFGGFSHRAVDLDVSEFEIERLSVALVEPRTYLAMLRVYLTKRIGNVRGALCRLNGGERCNQD